MTGACIQSPNTSLKADRYVAAQLGVERLLLIFSVVRFWPRLCENVRRPCFRGWSNHSLSLNRRSWRDLRGRLSRDQHDGSVFTQSRPRLPIRYSARKLMFAPWNRLAKGRFPQRRCVTPSTKNGRRRGSTAADQESCTNTR